MSITLTITGNKSILQTNYNPPLLLDGAYECGLIYFSTFNSIPNVTEENNIFAYGNDVNKISIPTGIYDLQDINEYLNENMHGGRLSIEPNNNTLKCSMYCTEIIHLDIKNSVAPLLGFPKAKYEANKWHEAVSSANILPSSVIRIECDIVHGSYTNGSPSHIIYEFVSNVPPSHRFIEIPNNILYFPITLNTISSITVKVVDIEGKNINFQGEDIQMCLHIRKLK